MAIAYPEVQRKFKDLRPRSRARLLQNSVTLQALVGDLQMRQHTLLWRWSCCGCGLTQHLQDCHTLKVMAPHCKCQGLWNDHSLPPAVVLGSSNPGVAGSAGGLWIRQSSSALDEDLSVQIVHVTDDYMQWWPPRLGSSLSSAGNPTADSSEHGRAGDGAAGAGAGCTKHVPGTLTIC
ncbi:uncharacterized protein LOC135096090 [Scylla paramamosain]|uniref:uncharacterized protein LOC135096090 n=1 Tax=Scylla paramamosain TaxID=85552 RepID=UPI003082731D